MYLILVRHAKAEITPPWIKDEERKLTPKGIKKAQAMARGVAKLLPIDVGLEIWSSHARRAKETAEIIGEVLGLEGVNEIPAIYTGRLEEIMEKFRQTSENTVVIAVGHQPHLGVWVRQLAGVTLPFKKCAAAGFKLSFTEEEVSAKLEWFAGPKVLWKLGE
ncbi:MAG: phosphohistidine phosphatase, SixA [Firmicutes bacterium]|nr:phosphohistidine phosphatase, SixA [Bacillota bacterium]